MASPPRHWRALIIGFVLVALGLTGAGVGSTLAFEWPFEQVASAATIEPIPQPSSPTTTAPAPEPTTSPSPGTATAEPKKQKKPKAATKTRKARHVPAEPRDDGHGKRIVYDKALMTVWLVDADDAVVARFPVVGRPDRPAAGTYHVYSKSKSTANTEQRLTFEYMTRFAWGTNDSGTSIGFHTIPRSYNGVPLHGEELLGLPLGSGGCVRMSTDSAKLIYKFAKKGTPVVVLPQTL